MPIVTVYHRAEFSVVEREQVDRWTSQLRQILAKALGGEEPDRALSPSEDFEIYMSRVGHRPGEHVRWDISIDIEAYDFDYRIANSRERADEIRAAASKSFGEVFGAVPQLAVWLKLVKAEWVESVTT